MRTDVETVTHWLAEARVAETHLTPTQQALLQHVFQFRQRCGSDYYSTRLLSHFLLHCHSELKVAQIARLLGIRRATAAAQQGMSSKEVVQATHQRLAGRAHGKLLPRFAGPIAEFLLENPKASRYDLLDFIERTWGVRVSRIALYHFLKKYGLDQTGRIAAVSAPAEPPSSAVPDSVEPPCSAVPDPMGATTVASPSPGLPVPLPGRNFFLPRPSTPAPSSSSPKPLTGSPLPNTASPMPTTDCAGDC
jgi:hypothetical protein